MPPRAIIGVMGRGSDASAEDVHLAEEVGERIAREGWILLTGGRREGVMGAASRGAKRVEGSLTVGILPGGDRSGMAPDVDVPIVTGMGSARNNVNALSSDVVIACGEGGPGTISEIALSIKTGKPVVLLRPALAVYEMFAPIAPVHPADSVDEAIAIVRAIIAGRSSYNSSSS
ncbi:MAG: cytochrome [Thermoanaerobaculia bacterium]